MVGWVLAVLLRPVTTQKSLLVAALIPDGYAGAQLVVPVALPPVAP
jgi:hypothetical protein